MNHTLPRKTMGRENAVASEHMETEYPYALFFTAENAAVYSIVLSRSVSARSAFSTMPPPSR